MQEIFHVHLHVFPRIAGDCFGLTFADRYVTKPTRAELNDVGEKIRRAVKQADG
jgi:diadenosine tetraphosphate (Ap4A) HIT family hydrolase